MVIETFKSGKKDQAYERFNSAGRFLPEGLTFINSWLEKDGNRCFQLMETDTPSLFDSWIKKWVDLVEFEIIPLEIEQ